MGFLAPAVPWLIKGGAALGGSLLGRKAQSSAMKRSPEEQAALAGAQGAAGELGTQGRALIGEGLPYLRKAGNYFSTLLGGNRAAMSQAVAGPTAALTDVYRGAERGLERSGLRGAARDVASGELNRQRASQIAGLVTGVQPAAASAVAGLGERFLGTGGPMLGQAGSIYSNLLGQGAVNREYARGEGAAAGKQIGGFIFDILSGTWKRKSGGDPNLPGGSPGPF